MLSEAGGTRDNSAVFLRAGTPWTDTPVEDRDFRVRNSLPRALGLFDGIHAADRSAVVRSDTLFPAPHALDEGNTLGRLAVYRPQQAAFEGAGGGEDALQLDGCDDIG